MTGTVLWGLLDHPHTRRVAVALEYWQIPHERRPLAEFGPAEILRRASPLTRPPLLSMPDGTLLLESRAILEFIDAEAPGELRLSPADPELWRDMLNLEAAALAATDLALDLTAERLRRAVPEVGQVARLEAGLVAALDWLEPQAGAGPLIGGRLSRADLALACLATYTAGKWPRLWGARRRLMAHRAWAEALPAFRATPSSLAGAQFGAEEDEG